MNDSKKRERLLQIICELDGAVTCVSLACKTNSESEINEALLELRVKHRKLQDFYL